MKYVEIEGSIFDSKVSNSRAILMSLDCEVSTVAQKVFAQRYPGLIATVKEAISSNKITGACSILFEDPNSSEKVFLLFVKQKHFNTFTYGDVSTSLFDMRTIAKQEKISEINIALNGSKLTSLEQKMISKYVDNIFSESNISIKIFK